MPQKERNENSVWMWWVDRGGKAIFLADQKRSGCNEEGWMLLGHNHKTMEGLLWKAYDC